VPQNFQGKATSFLVSVTPSVTLGAAQGILMFTSEEHTASLAGMYAIVSQPQFGSESFRCVVRLRQTVLLREDMLLQETEKFVGAVVAHSMYCAKIHEQHSCCQLAGAGTMIQYLH
jgi:hypothetical protein